MEIPNYDINTTNKKFKQRYSFMPKDTFRMLICGNGGSGKTNLLYHMLIEPLLYYDEIHLYAKNLEQQKYQNLMNKMNHISAETGYDIMTVSNGRFHPRRRTNRLDGEIVSDAQIVRCENGTNKFSDDFVV